MQSSISLSVYKKFENDFVKPYVSKKKAGESIKEEEIKMIDKYIKLGPNVKKIVSQQLPKLWEAILNKAFLEREKRKKGLVEEEMKLKDIIKKEARNK
jgi:hypothetical protein